MLKFKMIFAMALILLISCSSKCTNDKISFSKVDSNSLPHFNDTEFDKFYSRFFSDSIFQLNHLKFPLEGGISYCDSIQEFTKTNWRYLNGNFLKNKIAGDSLVINSADHQIELRMLRPEIGVLTELKFKKIDGNWFLFFISINAC